MRRRTLLAAPLLALTAPALAACSSDGRPSGGGMPSGAPSDGAPSGGTVGRWLSGASGSRVADGEVAAWRGRELDLVGTWADTPDASVALYELQPDGPLAGWTGAMDIAVGALGPGESWSDAAAGAYDERWAGSLTALAALRAGAGTTFVRFAHEANGDWYDWSVDAASAADFRTAWGRYRGLQQEHMPDARLVFCPNSQSVGTGADWRETFPGADAVDLLAVDHYNQYPFVSTPEAFEEELGAVDGWGAPRGLARHAEFAAEVGLPFAVPEWSSNSELGDSAVFVEQMHGFFARYGGEGPGQLVYEVLFNVEEFDDGKFALHPRTAMPDAAAAYRDLW
ncbi:hypothetical protein [Aquipuribacter hungaricus]|uniref:GH26 domain-containing protein n=1 Tax=Aquipuribacter hungaricus TaxID=545624 RepID=A0ABV7WAK0_9MICO